MPDTCQARVRATLTFLERRQEHDLRSRTNASYLNRRKAYLQQIEDGKGQPYPPPTSKDSMTLYST